MANLSWKEQRRKDWDRRLAEIDQEIEALHAREQKLWARIQLNSVQRGIAAQKRHYSTTAATRFGLPFAIWKAETETEAQPRQDSLEELNPLPLTHEEPFTEPDEGEQGSDKETGTAWYSSDELAPENAQLKRFDRLIAFRLAMQMLLQVHIGGNSKFTGDNDLDQLAHQNLSWDINIIVRRLKDVSNELAQVSSLSLQRYRHRPSGSLRESADVRRLNGMLHGLGLQYRQGSIKLPGLVERFAHIILENPVPPNIRTYTTLIHLFNYIEREDLSFLVASALRKSSLYLDQIAVHTLLWRYGKSRELRMLDEFLRELTKTGGKVLDPWEWRRVHNTRIPVPSTFSSLICTRLIAAALACDQPDRAEAWAVLMAEERPLHVRRLIIMKHFIYHYDIALNWDKGKLWMAQVIEFACKWKQTIKGFVGDPVQEMRLTILQMLDLCLACGKADEYATILKAVTNVGIRPPVLASPRPQFYRDTSLRIVREWDTAWEAVASFHNAGSPEEQISAFGERLIPLLQVLKTLDQNTSAVALGLDDPVLAPVAETKDITNHDEVMTQQQNLLQSMEQLAISNNSMQVEAQRSADQGQVETEGMSLQQQQIEELRQELLKLKEKSQESISDAAGNGRLGAIIAEQSAAMQRMQEQISQLMNQVSEQDRSPKPRMSDRIFEDYDADSGYGSDFVSGSGSGDVSWWHDDDADLAGAGKPYNIPFRHVNSGQPATSQIHPKASPNNKPKPTLSHRPLRKTTRVTQSSSQSQTQSKAQDSSSELQLSKHHRLLLTSLPRYLRWMRIPQTACRYFDPMPLPKYLSLNLTEFQNLDLSRTQIDLLMEHINSLNALDAEQLTTATEEAMKRTETEVASRRLKVRKNRSSSSSRTKPSKAENVEIAVARIQKTKVAGRAQRMKISEERKLAEDAERVGERSFNPSEAVAPTSWLNIRKRPAAEDDNRQEQDGSEEHREGKAKGRDADADAIADADVIAAESTSNGIKLSSDSRTHRLRLQVVSEPHLLENTSIGTSMPVEHPNSNEKGNHSALTPSGRPGGVSTTIIQQQNPSRSWLL